MRTITPWFPLACGRRARKSRCIVSTESSAHDSRSAKSILIVDDNAELANAIRAYLEVAAYAVTCVYTGKDAVRLLEQQPFDVVITDIFMADVDGMEIMMQARRKRRSAAIIAISGGGAVMGAQESLALAKKLGAYAVLEKPFAAADLLALLAGVP
jgi:two-component system chemotaxis response regulator CheY